MSKVAKRRITSQRGIRSRSPTRIHYSIGVLVSMIISFMTRNVLYVSLNNSWLPFNMNSIISFDGAFRLAIRFTMQATIVERLKRKDSRCLIFISARFVISRRSILRRGGDYNRGRNGQGSVLRASRCHAGPFAFSTRNVISFRCGNEEREDRMP